MADSAELHKMIEQDASTVRDRQETDSIAVVDDIRSHIRCGDGDTGVEQW